MGAMPIRRNVWVYVSAQVEITHVGEAGGAATIATKARCRDHGPRRGPEPIHLGRVFKVAVGRRWAVEWVLKDVVQVSVSVA